MVPARCTLSDATAPSGTGKRGGGSRWGVHLSRCFLVLSVPSSATEADNEISTGFHYTGSALESGKDARVRARGRGPGSQISMQGKHGGEQLLPL